MTITLDTHEHTALIRLVVEKLDSAVENTDDLDYGFWYAILELLVKRTN